MYTIVLTYSNQIPRNFHDSIQYNILLILTPSMIISNNCYAGYSTNLTYDQTVSWD